MSSTDWKPHVGEIVRLKINRTQKLPKGSIGIVVQHPGNYRNTTYIKWRRGPCESVDLVYIKPAKPESLSNSAKVWAVKQLMNGS